MFIKMIQGLKWLISKRVRTSGLLFTRNNIHIDYDFEYYNKGIFVYIEVWFDPKKKFGIKLYDDDTVNVYAYLPTNSDDVQVSYIIHRGDGRIEDEQIYNSFTKSEKILIREMANEVTLKETKMTIEAFCYKFEKEELRHDA